MRAVQGIGYFLPFYPDVLKWEIDHRLHFLWSTFICTHITNYNMQATSQKPSCELCIVFFFKLLVNSYPVIVFLIMPVELSLCEMEGHFMCGKSISFASRKCTYCLYNFYNKYLLWKFNVKKLPYGHLIKCILPCQVHIHSVEKPFCK